MKFYVACVQNDSTQSVYAYNNIDDAMAFYHSELGYRSEQRNKTLCVLFREDGAVMCHEVWERKLEENEGES